MSMAISMILAALRLPGSVFAFHHGHDADHPASSTPVAAQTTTAPTTMAHGFVFNDANANRKRDDGEAGVAGVRVSNGLDIVYTRADGAYELPIGDDTILFINKPTDWMTALDDHQLPKFYYIHKPAGSPKLKYGGVAPTGGCPGGSAPATSSAGTLPFTVT